MSTTDVLVTFLRARLDEDERAARAASPGPWHLNAEGDEVLAVDDVTAAECFALSNRQLRATAAHIARHDPARVLREVEAKRQMILSHMPVSMVAGWGCSADGITGYCSAMRFLALLYADHPEYRPEWAP
jgi:hypothetical protein